MSRRNDEESDCEANQSASPTLFAYPRLAISFAYATSSAVGGTSCSSPVYLTIAASSYAVRRASLSASCTAGSPTHPWRRALCATAPSASLRTAPSLSDGMTGLRSFWNPSESM